MSAITTNRCIPVGKLFNATMPLYLLHCNLIPLTTSLKPNALKENMDDAELKKRKSL